MRRHKCLMFLGGLFLAAGLCFAQGQLPRLRVSENGRYLVKQDGSPFFYLADTAWGLFHFNREDVDLYLKTRAGQRFTAIQAIVAHYGGLDSRNAYGQTVFVNKDPAHPNEAYFQHVDYVVNEAESLGLYVALVPLWCKEYVNEKGSILTKETAFSYGKFLASRYRNKPVLFILGGDWYPDKVEDLMRAMAAGIAEGDGGAHLKTYHPTGIQSSSTWFHNDAWLDFNMVQSRHMILNRTYDLIRRTGTRRRPSRWWKANRYTRASRTIWYTAIPTPSASSRKTCAGRPTARSLPGRPVTPMAPMALAIPGHAAAGGVTARPVRQ